MTKGACLCTGSINVHVLNFPLLAYVACALLRPLILLLILDVGTSEEATRLHGISYIQ